MRTIFRKELIISAAFIVGSIVLIAIGLYFIAQHLDSRAIKILGTRLLIKERSEANATLAGLKTSAAQAEKYKATLEKMLVTQDQLLEFRPWIHGLAQGRQVGLNADFEGNATQPTDSAPGAAGFYFDASGAANNVLEFVKDLESRSQRFLVTISGFNVTQSAGSYRFVGHGQVYFRTD